MSLDACVRGVASVPPVRDGASRGAAAARCVADRRRPRAPSLRSRRRRARAARSPARRRRMHVRVACISIVHAIAHASPRGASSRARRPSLRRRRVAIARARMTFACWRRAWPLVRRGRPIALSIATCTLGERPPRPDLARTGGTGWPSRFAEALPALAGPASSPLVDRRVRAIGSASQATRRARNSADRRWPRTPSRHAATPAILSPSRRRDGSRAPRTPTRRGAPGGSRAPDAAVASTPPQQARPRSAPSPMVWRAHGSAAPPHAAAANRSRRGGRSRVRRARRRRRTTAERAWRRADGTRRASGAVRTGASSPRDRSPGRRRDAAHRAADPHRARAAGTVRSHGMALEEGHHRQCSTGSQAGR